MVGRLHVLFPLILTFSPGEKGREAVSACRLKAAVINPAVIIFIAAGSVVHSPRGRGPG